MAENDKIPQVQDDENELEQKGKDGDLNNEIESETVLSDFLHAMGFKNTKKEKKTKDKQEEVPRDGEMTESVEEEESEPEHEIMVVPEQRTRRRWPLGVFGAMALGGAALGIYHSLPMLQEPKPPAPDVVATYNDQKITIEELKNFIAAEGAKEREHMIKRLAGNIPYWIFRRLEEMEELFGWFLKNDKRYILFLQQDSREHLTFMAVNREIPKYLDATLWSRGFPAILTSGTLKAGNGFARTRQMTGLEKETGVRECVAESPFCYKENCLLYIPEHLKPRKKGSREEAEQLAGQIRDLVCSTYGHTLVLFTSYTLMGNVQQLLRDQIPFPMVQVWRNSQEEIARFKKMENAVLFAAGSCWEGVDFPGDMVSSLIIVKLPFSVPDPIHEAQKEQYRSLESYIQTIVVPDMQKKLRQGFGRAIRTEQDTCVVSILDHRATKKGRYRSDVLDALPKCRMAERIEEVEDFIRSRKVERYYS